MNSNGCYLYGVVPKAARIEFGDIGLGGKRVYAVPCQDVAAVIHDCSEKVYFSDDKEMVKSWIVTHQAVVEEAWGRCGTIVPISFDTIIKGGGGALVEWLTKNQDTLVSQLKFLSGKAEYSVQLFWDEKKVNEEIMKTDEELGRLQEDALAASKGTAYLYQKKTEKLIKDRFDKKADDFRNSTYERIKEITGDISIEKLKGAADGQRMIMNISCLIRREDEGKLGHILEETESSGCKIRFTGPWPPYSFSDVCHGS